MRKSFLREKLANFLFDEALTTWATSFRRSSEDAVLTEASLGPIKTCPTHEVTTFLNRFYSFSSVAVTGEVRPADLCDHESHVLRAHNFIDVTSGENFKEVEGRTFCSL